MQVNPIKPMETYSALGVVASAEVTKFCRKVAKST